MHTIPVTMMTCFFVMPSAISKSKYSTATVVQKKFQPSPSPEQSKPEFSRTLHQTPVNNNNFSFGLNCNAFLQSQLSKPFGTCLSGIGCHVNININNSMHPQQNNNAKRKRHIIYSDFEESQG